MNIQLLCVGKNSENYLTEGEGVFLKRLLHYCKFEKKTIPDLKNKKNLPISEIKDELTQKNIDLAAITDLETLLDQCSFLAYSPDSSNPSSKLDICDKAIDIIKRINV